MSDIRFKPSVEISSSLPIKGETYYLYQQSDESLFLSIIEPEHWNQIFIGAFRLNSNDIWEKIG